MRLVRGVYVRMTAVLNREQADAAIVKQTSCMSVIEQPRHMETWSWFGGMVEDHCMCTSVSCVWQGAACVNGLSSFIQCFNQTRPSRSKPMVNTTFPTYSPHVRTGLVPTFWMLSIAILWIGSLRIAIALASVTMMALQGRPVVDVHNTHKL